MSRAARKCFFTHILSRTQSNIPHEPSAPEKEGERRAWATVSKESGGGNISGSGRGHAENHASSEKGGYKGGKPSASRPKAERSASAKKAAATRKRNEHHAHH